MCRPIASHRGATHTPNLPLKWTFCGSESSGGGGGGEVRPFKKSTFGVLRVHSFGVLHLLPIDPGYRPVCVLVEEVSVSHILHSWGALNFSSGRGVWPGFVKWGACELILPLKEGACEL